MQDKLQDESGAKAGAGPVVSFRNRQEPGHESRQEPHKQDSLSSPLRWIALNDGAASLKLGSLSGLDGGRYDFLFLTGLEPGGQRWQQAIDCLGFVASVGSQMLARMLQPGEKVRPSMFQPVWPHACVRGMSPREVMLESRKAQEPGAQKPEQESVTVGEILQREKMQQPSSPSSRPFFPQGRDDMEGMGAGEAHMHRLMLEQMDAQKMRRQAIERKLMDGGRKSGLWDGVPDFNDGAWGNETKGASGRQKG